LSFYRDSNGAETDLLIENSLDITLVEMKSASTPSASLFSGAHRVARHLQELPGSCQTCVVYGGTDYQNRNEGELIPWNQLHIASFLTTPNKLF